VLNNVLSTNPALREHALETEKAGQRAASLTKLLQAFSRRRFLPRSSISTHSLPIWKRYFRGC